MNKAEICDLRPLRLCGEDFNRRGAESAEKTQRKAKIRIMRINDLTKEIIGAAIEVHRTLGPGLLESAYEECLCHELQLRDLHFERQKPLPVVFKEVKLECGYRLDLLVFMKLSFSRISSLGDGTSGC